MSYALLRFKQLGVPDPAAKAIGAFLDHAQHHIKTQMGASEHFYTSGDNGYLQHGPGQGSLEGPPLWVIVSSGPIDVLCDRFAGLCFDDPDLVSHVCSIIQGFVDDIDLATNNFLEELQNTMTNGYDPAASLLQLQRLLHNATSMAQWWEQLLWATGRKLEVPKCFIYIMHWTFNAKGEALLLPKQDLLTHNLTMTISDSETTQPALIDILDCNTHSRTLGVHIVPAGNSGAEAQRLLAKSKSLGARLTSSCLSPHDGFCFYQSIYRPSLFYMLPVSYLSVREGNAIMAASTGPMLNACGFHCNFLCALTFATKPSGGLGFSHIYDEQGNQHLCTILLPHLCAPTGQLHNFLCILYQWAHLVCGFADPPLSTLQL